MPIYAMSTAKILLASCRELNALMRKYWWLGNVEKNRFLALKAWDRICQPKASGGLGVRRCEDMNKALFTKLAWSLATKEQKPWVSCLLNKYFRYDCFLNVSSKSSDSYQWKCILDTRSTILRGSISVAALGNSIDFWHQPWIPWLEYQEFVELMNIGLRNRGYTIKTLADISIGNNWNEEMVLQIFGSEMGNQILAIPRIPSPYQGRMYWKSSPKDTFSVKAAYCVEQCWRFAPVKNIWKWIWERNAFCINNVHVNPSLALAKAEKDFLELQIVPFRKDHEGYNHTNDSMRNGVILVPAIKQVCHVLFTDASWVRGEAGIAAISVNTSSGCWFVNSQKLQVVSALEGELRAILLALNWAVE
uniref:RNase H type-1 domain-containing protein n=1 Tax=Cannabis sativa TaxID=3483 RepID=A0A803QFT9_CANSA